jgi:DNA ligase D-like protein (predicted 3'-phosphoesterase)
MRQLDEYRRKRRFDKTPEPATGKPSAGGNRFVVQKHAARRLHYDFRLEINGVLVSWAVPKGPSLNPADKRLAVQTEDHPLDYGGFEHNPRRPVRRRQVMVWDTGTYEMEGDLSAAQQLARGEPSSFLRGRKLRGGFVLVKLSAAKRATVADDQAQTPPSIPMGHRRPRRLRAHRPHAHRIAEACPRHRPSPGSSKAREAAMPARCSLWPHTVDKPFSDPMGVRDQMGRRARMAWVKNGKLTCARAPASTSPTSTPSSARCRPT